MRLSVKNIFFKSTNIKTFFITRLTENQIEEKVMVKKGTTVIDVTHRQSMICLDPFCISIWLPSAQIPMFNNSGATLFFTKGGKTTASLTISLIELTPTDNGALFLYKIERVKNHQLSLIHRVVLLGYLLRSKKNTYESRKVISALYSYPRKIIIVSYQDNEYYNIFPMDIQGYIPEEDIYILGLRTTNVTLQKILAAKKVVICESDEMDIETIYRLGKHSSTSPTKKEEMPFAVQDSEVFGFPVPATIGGYKEVEIFYNRKMGYHMLLVGKVANNKLVRKNPASFYHVGFLQFQKSNYQSIDGIY
jgi:flavin reductase (DIM6/NTAB) family NADH-FMN oxidoreductase RutF